MSAIRLQDVVVEYAVRGPLGARPEMRRALDGVSVQIERGESFGLVGESGCGKSTTANVLMGIAPVTSGAVLFDDEPVPARRTPALRRHIQMVFQDPASSLNPRRRVRAMLSELIAHHRLVPSGGMDARLRELMDMVGLPASVLGALPGNLSGGQRQRIAIARALAVEPKVLIADEAVSALDVSAQAKVINLLADLRDELGLTLLFISHDLAVVRALCTRAMVMRAGAVVETADIDTLFTAPREDYTRRLLAAVPDLGPAV